MTVRPDTLDQFEVLARVRNDGPAIEYAPETTTIVDGPRIAGMGSTSVLRCARDEVRTLQFIGPYPFSRYDGIDFQIDDLELAL